MTDEDDLEFDTLGEPADDIEQLELDTPTNLDPTGVLLADPADPAIEGTEGLPQ